MTQNLAALLPVLKAAPVVPVLIIEDFHKAIPLARALVAGGLTAIEVTLRTPSALDCIRAIKSEVEGCNVGAGTILTPKQFDEAVAAGSAFLVSPGASPKLLAHAAGSPVPLLPGIATASEAMILLEEGYGAAKFFPAEQSGGAAYLKALASPLPGLVFCPTGSITMKIAPDYLSLPNVVCVGGSWVAPVAAVKAGDWAVVTSLAREASALRTA